jgi:putative resolvase
VNKHTAYRWFREGTLPVPARRVGRLILVELPGEQRRAARTVVYARVSAADQRSDLARQVDRLAGEVTGRGLSVDEVVREVGSGMTGRRPKLRRVLSDPTARTVVVEHRDRLARFGVEHLAAVLAAQGRRLPTGTARTRVSPPASSQRRGTRDLAGRVGSSEAGVGSGTAALMGAPPE